MDLKTYLQTLTLVERDEFAKRCQTSAQHLANISYGYRACGESLAIEIEKHSERKVRCEEIRPDVDWAFLRGTARRTAKPAANT